MEVRFEGRDAIISRPETELDRFVKEFVSILETSGIGYVLVSGYVAILFGRSRNSEDVDILVENVDFGRFERFWKKASGSMDCINAEDPKRGFEDYLSDSLALRFSRKSKPIPNMEVKFAKTELDEWTIANAANAALNGYVLKVSPLELQIPYKLYLGSFKDIEDARHLWLVTKSHLDIQMLDSFIGQLGVKKEAAKWLS
jgi:hypothetical protein